MLMSMVNDYFIGCYFFNDNFFKGIFFLFICFDDEED